MKFRILTFRDYGRVLNRCATVEQILLDMYHGKKPLPDKDGCRELSRKLGVSDD
jgi:hypothetical protein